MNEKRMNELSKIFRDGPIAISRQDYESMPCPMAALLVSDDGMRAIAKDVHARMARNWNDSEIKDLLGRYDEYDESDDVAMCHDELWREMEAAARSAGMKYYDKLPDGAV